MYAVHNIQGQRFGYLTAIRFDHWDFLPISELKK